MILYVNGDSHSAGAEIVEDYCFAQDDPKHWRLGREPHPECLEKSYGKQLADRLNCDFICEAESASSNHRIIRTTHNYFTGVQGLPAGQADFVVIGWSTWERKEFHDIKTGIDWQVNAGGIGSDFFNAHVFITPKVPTARTLKPQHACRINVRKSGRRLTPPPSASFMSSTCSVPPSLTVSNG
jgi:hypothetical protein